MKKSLHKLLLGIFTMGFLNLSIFSYAQTVELVENISNHNEPLGSEPVNLTSINGKLLFRAYATAPQVIDPSDPFGQTTSPYNVYHYEDGVITELQDFVGGFDFGYPTNFTVLDTMLYFTALSYGYGSYVVFRTNGDKTAPIQPTHVNSDEFSGYSFLTAADTVLYTSWNHSTTGYELYTIGANGEGDQLVMDIAPGTAHSHPQSVVRAGGNTYFTANNNTDGRQLYKYTGDTCYMVKDITPGSSSNGIYTDLTVVGDMIYFGGSGEDGQELWVCNVLTDSVYQVADIKPGPGDSEAQDMHDFNGILCFGADGENGYEFFTWDGSNLTEFDINPGPNESSPSDFVVIDDKILFAAYTDTTGSELFQFDGNEVTLVADINPNGSSYPQHGIGVDGFFYFNANDGSTGQELWVYDGINLTSYDVIPGASGSNPKYFAQVGDEILMQATDPTNNEELWKISCFPTLKHSSIYSCGPYTSTSGKEFTTSGVYTDSIPKPNGCDTIVRITLTVNNLEAITTQNGNMLTVDSAGLLYQWLDCDNSYDVISGETNQSFTAQNSGIYGVVVSDGTCADTSECTLVTITSTNIVENSDVLVYPIPNNGSLNLKMKQNGDYNIKIQNSQGILIKQIAFNGSEMRLDISDQPAGVYIISVISDKVVYTQQLLKK